MCECSCGELNIVAAFRLKGTDAVIALDKYIGCGSCGLPIGVGLHVFTLDAFPTYSDLIPVEIEADEFGGPYGKAFSYVQFFNLRDLAQAADSYDRPPEDYETSGDLLEDLGHGLIYAAINEREMKEKRRKGGEA